MRGTLHLVAAEDHGWLHDLTAGQSAATIRAPAGAARHRVRTRPSARSASSPPRSQDGPLARPQLGERLRAAGIATEGQRVPHLLGLAASRGLIVLGPVLPDGHGFVLARDWLEPSGSPARTATPRSPSWRGATCAATARRRRTTSPRGRGSALRAARAAFAAIAGELAADGELADAAGRDAPAGPSRRACCPPTTPTCWAGATGRSRSRPSTRAASIRAAAIDPRDGDRRRPRRRDVDRARRHGPARAVRAAGPGRRGRAGARGRSGRGVQRAP